MNLFEVRKNNFNRLLDSITLLGRYLSTRLQKEDDTGDTRQHVSFADLALFFLRPDITELDVKIYLFRKIDF
jgi:hypothetical protein